MSETNVFRRKRRFFLDKKIKKGIEKKRGDMSKQFVFLGSKKSKTQNWRCESAQNRYKKKGNRKITRRNEKKKEQEKHKENKVKNWFRKKEMKTKTKSKMKKRREKSEERNKKTKRGLKNGSKKKNSFKFENAQTRNMETNIEKKGNLFF